ncbi:MAG: hypothetical protein LC731_01845, partial [Acidobacteria bacterium]|nr:hypothetical protein [Acidobacteriota bacterium]
LIEKLYRKLNGSLTGLEARLGTGASLKTASNTSSDNQPASAEVKTNEMQTTASMTDATKSTTPAKTDDSAQQGSTPTQNAAANQTASAASQPENQTAASTTQQPRADTGTVKETQTGGSNSSQPTATPEPSPDTSASRPRRKQNEGGACSFSINVDKITVKSNGGTGLVVVNLSGSDKITPTTRDWPDITVFGQMPKEYGSFPFVITSISKRTGSYTVTFTTPCGSKDITVIVK